MSLKANRYHPRSLPIAMALWASDVFLIVAQEQGAGTFAGRRKAQQLGHQYTHALSAVSCVAPERF